MDKITTCELVFNRENSKHFHLYLWINLTGYFHFSPIFKRISEITVRQLFNLLRKFFAKDFVDFFNMALKKYLLRFSCLYLTNQKVFPMKLWSCWYFLWLWGSDKDYLFWSYLDKGHCHWNQRGAGGNRPSRFWPKQKQHIPLEHRGTTGIRPNHLLAAKVNSVQEACAKWQMLFGSHIKIWNLANHMKKMKQKTSEP